MLYFLLPLLLLFLPKKETAAPPNILFILADDAGMEMSAYGCTWVKTPAFDRIAQEGMLFENAYTPNAKCAPSRACILTGRDPWQLEEACNHEIFFPNHFKTYPEAMLQQGYQIGFTGKGYAPGKALKADGAKRELLGEEFNQLKLVPPAGEISNNDYVGNFQAFLSGTSGQPWCFWVGFTEPHRAYEYGVGERHGKKKSDIPRVPDYWPDTDSVRTDLLDYVYEIEYMDAQVQRLLQQLEAVGQLDNTLIIYTSDHGMPFPRVKGNQYEHSNHIPLAMMWKKGIPHAGRKIRDYVSFIDLAPTFLAIAGINWQKSGMHPAAGKSLLPILNSAQSGQIQAERNFVLVGQERHDYGRPGDVGYPIRGLHKNGYLYLKNYEPSRWPACNPETGYLNTDGSPTKTFLLNQRRRDPQNRYFWNLNFGKRPKEELYNLSSDPDCVKNLALNPRFTALARRMEKEMEAKLRAEGDLRMFGYGHVYEQYPFANVNGFYERYLQGEKIHTGWVNPSDYESKKIEE